MINKELSTISTKQEEVLQQLESAKEGGDNETALDLQNQLEQITNKHLQLLTEQSDTLRKQRWGIRITLLLVLLRLVWVCTVYLS